jgi:hypothetical protein
VFKGVDGGVFVGSRSTASCLSRTSSSRRRIDSLNSADDPFAHSLWETPRSRSASAHRGGRRVEAPTPVKAGYESVPSFWKVAPAKKPICGPNAGMVGTSRSMGPTRRSERSRPRGVRVSTRSGPRDVQHRGHALGTRQVWRFANIPVGAKIVANDARSRVVGSERSTDPTIYKDEVPSMPTDCPSIGKTRKSARSQERGWVRTSSSFRRTNS